MDGKENVRIVTIYDIAKEAGVSTATVSRVLSGNTGVKKDKRDKVMSLVEKYHYKPNALARGLVDTKSKVIGIITADIRNLFYSQMYVSCEMAAQKKGYTVLLCNSFGRLEQEERQLEKLLEQRVDAIILLGGSADGTRPDDRFLSKMGQINRNIPIILAEKVEKLDCHVVRINAEKTMDIVLEYLMERKHRKIAFLGGRDNVISTVTKIRRYQEILERCGIPYDERLVGKNGTYDWDTGYSQMNELYSQNILPTAVIAVNDFAALGVMRSISEHGMRIPEDVSVVSYDNTYITELYVPRITSIDYNYDLFGHKLVEAAVAAAEGREIPHLQSIEPRLVVRDSSGEARQ